MHVDNGTYVIKFPPDGKCSYPSFQGQLWEFEYFATYTTLSLECCFENSLATC